MDMGKSESFFSMETGEKIVVKKREYSRGDNFVKMYIKDMIKILEVIGGGRAKVIIYILRSLRLSDNTLIKTQREIADACEVSTKTVNETLKGLSDKGILKKKSGAYMLSPTVFYRGDDQKKGYMLNQFELFDEKSNKDI
jgi:DNA-binding HxlR family transcriptional regulator